MLRAGRGRYSARAALRRRSLVWPEVGGGRWRRRRPREQQRRRCRHEAGRAHPPAGGG